MRFAKFFYYLATFVWKQHDIRDDLLTQYQQSLITKVFGVLNVRGFIFRTKNDVMIPTWDGKAHVMVKEEAMVRIHKEACIIGPLAALFGREVQQFLMVNPDAKLITMTEFQHSVDSGRVSLSQRRVEEQRRDADMIIDDERASQRSMRTRSPRRPLYRDIRRQEANLQPTRRG